MLASTERACGSRPPLDTALALVLLGSLDDVWGELCRLSRRGAGIFVTINETDLRGRRAENIVRVRSLFADLDGEPVENIGRVPLRPSWVTNSSRGRFHAYWRVEDMRLYEFMPLQLEVAKWRRLEG